MNVAVRTRAPDAERRKPTLTSIHVMGLLGHFDHKINFPAGWPFLILYGPNGVGKTKLLELIHAAFANQPDRLARIPFGSVTFGFDDGRALQIAYAKENLETGLSVEPIASGRVGPQDLVKLEMQTLAYLYRGPDGSVCEWVYGPLIAGPTPEALKVIESTAPVTPGSAGLWRDHHHGDILDAEELFARYSDRMTAHMPGAKKVPPPLLTFFEDVNVYLIETQRLLTRRSAQARRTAGAPSARRPTSRVLEYADDLARRIKMALAQNSTVSQRLERTFPRRIVERGLPETIPSDEAIREKYNAQRELRNELAEIDVTDMGEDLPLPPGELLDWQRTVLFSYLDDAGKKLGTFRPLLDRVNVFRSIIRARFKYKHLQISRDKGFIFRTYDDTEISPDKLSSGEQQELVLIYDLVFNVPKGTLVLIDEPEISLHVSWQQRFLQDISRIAELNALRFIVATHSPQVVHKSWSKAIALAPDDDDDTE